MTLQPFACPAQPRGQQTRGNPAQPYVKMRYAVEWLERNDPDDDVVIAALIYVDDDYRVMGPDLATYIRRELTRPARDRFASLF